MSTTDGKPVFPRWFIVVLVLAFIAGAGVVGELIGEQAGQHRALADRSMRLATDDPATATGCAQAYSDQKDVSDSLRGVISSESAIIVNLLRGDNSIADSTDQTDRLTGVLKSINAQENNIDASSCRL